MSSARFGDEMWNTRGVKSSKLTMRKFSKKIKIKFREEKEKNDK